MRPITILIAALGGEGGGLLSELITQAAVNEGFVAQRTSIPGVAQRTGATSYYIEIYPVPLAELNGKRPVLSLHPQPGNVDLMASTELMEAGRMLLGGYVTPDRTTLVASTHRVFTVQEKSGASDGRFDGTRILDALNKYSQEAILFDMDAAAKEAGSIINSVLLGALVASGKMPISAEALKDAIRETGKAVEANLRGFEMGLSGGKEASTEEEARPRLRNVPVDDLIARARQTFSEQTHGFIFEGITRLADYQNRKYAELYLDRLESIRDMDEGDYQLTNEVARHLALWMAYQDLIRVAQQKSSRDRFKRVRQEIRAEPNQPFVLVEYFKPGVEEFCSVLPPFIARPILRWAERRGKNYNVGMHIKSNTIWGFLQLYALTRLRPFRPRSYRYKEENHRIEAWLSNIRAAGDLALALEIAKCAGIIKGYGDTYNRGWSDYNLILERAIKPALAGRVGAETVREARLAVLSDPDSEKPGSRDFGFVPLASIE